MTGKAGKKGIYGGDLVVVGMAILLLAVAIGCAGTVTPRAAVRGEASWDGTNQNSGVICLTNGGALITGHARERYNALVGAYGARFAPALGMDAGIQPIEGGGAFWIDAEHLAAWAAMSRWRRGEGK